MGNIILLTLLTRKVSDTCPYSPNDSFDTVNSKVRLIWCFADLAYDWKLCNTDIRGLDKVSWHIVRVLNSLFVVNHELIAIALLNSF